MILSPNSSLPIFPQRGSELRSLAAENLQVAQAAAAIKLGKIIMWENGPVMALAGDSNNPQLQQNIAQIKRDRSPDQPVGWITPFLGAIAAFDLKDVKDVRLKAFLSDSDEMTRRLGAIAFVRGKADMAYKAEKDIPDALIPKQDPDKEPSQVQLYSPTTNSRCSKLVRYTSIQGVKLAMTSANYHGHNEIVTHEEALAFAENAEDLQFFPQFDLNNKPERPRGSYPVLKILPDRLQLIRYGFLDPKIIQSILHDLPVDISALAEGSGQKPKHPEKILHLEDLPLEVRISKLNRGARLHDAVVKSFMEPAAKA